MGNTARVDFTTIKAAADFRRVLAHYEAAGVLALPGTSGRGDQVMIRCPFHDDHQASLSVNVAKGLFHCFNEGACGARGNVLDFVHRMELEGGRACSLREAALVLAEICGIAVDAPKSPAEARRASKSAGRANTRPEDVSSAVRDPGQEYEVSESELEGNKPLKPVFLERFQATLERDHPYFATRGLTPEDVARFGLGFQTAGAWQNRVVLPITNHEGEILAYAGRWALGDENLPEGAGKYKLPARKHFRPDQALFNHHRAYQARHVTVVEGYFGALALDKLGIPAVAVMGNTIAPQQVALLKAFPNLRALTLMFDGGAHCQETTLRAFRTLLEQGAATRYFIRALELPEGAQPDTVPRALLLEPYPSLTRQSSTRQNTVA